MKTNITHSVIATDVAVEKTWQNQLQIKLKEGDTEIVATVTPAMLQDLMKRARNTLIDAKVIRGKKIW